MWEISGNLWKMALSIFFPGIAAICSIPWHLKSPVLHLGLKRWYARHGPGRIAWSNSWRLGPEVSKQQNICIPYFKLCWLIHTHRCLYMRYLLIYVLIHLVNFQLICTCVNMCILQYIYIHIHQCEANGYVKTCVFLCVYIYTYIYIYALSNSMHF